MVRRLLDFCKGLISLLAILALLAGIPALLLVFIGFPLPTEVPSIDLIRRHVEDGEIPDLFLIKTLALTAWFVWTQLAAAILVEMAALIRGRLSRRAPVLPGVQTFVGKLVASTVLLVSAFAPTRSAGPAPIVAPAALADSGPGFDLAAAGVGDLGLRANGSGGLTTVGLATPSVANAPKAEVAGTTMGGQVYATRGGDNWWDLAERLLGDGMRWSELRSLNVGRTMATGELVTDQTESVRAGWHLVVPSDAAADLLTPQPGLDTTPFAFGAERPATLVFPGPSGSELVGSGPAYQVVEGDNLWDIAEAHLGDPFRWPEIFEASTGLTQPFGRQITDPNLIWPDSILVLPTDAVDVPRADPALVLEVLGAPATAGEASADGEASTELQPGDLDRIADRVDELLDPPRLEADRGEANQPGQGPSSEHDVDGATTPGAGAVAEAASGPSGPGDPGPPSGPGSALTNPAAVAMASGALLMATGLLGLLRRARRLRLAEIGAASVPEPPPLELVDVETVLRNRSDRVAAQTLIDSVATLARGVERADEPTATPEVVRVVGDRIEVVLQQTGAAPPAPWREVSVAGAPDGLEAGRRVVVASLDQLAAADGSIAAADGSIGGPADIAPAEPAPTLVTVGGGLLVNLEAIGVLAIDGTPELVAGLTRSMIHELATGVSGEPARPNTPAVQVLVSDHLPGIDLHPSVRCGPLDRMVAELESWLDQVQLALAATGASGPWALRAAGHGATFPPAVVVVADGADDLDGPAVAQLAERARDRRLPLAVVLVGDPRSRSIEPSMTASIGAGRVELAPLGLAASFQAIDVELILGVEALIEHARRAPIVARGALEWPVEDPWFGAADVGNGAPRGPDSSQGPTEETPEHEIATEVPEEEAEVTDRSNDEDRGLLIRVLGPVEVVGGPSELTEEQRSVLAFLALAGPSTADQVRAAIWPGVVVDDERFQSVIGDLARRLGPLFPQAGDGRYRVRSTITDLGSARRWIAQAQAMTGERSRNLMQLALSEVRGRPFEGVPEAHWQWIEDHRLAITTQATSLLIDACFDLCDSAYGADDLHQALWACEVASLVDPLQETVVTRRVQLLSILERDGEAAAVVDRWEQEFARSAGRPAPRGPRTILNPVEEAVHVV